MSNQFPKLFSPMNIGNVTIKNRVVMCPMMLDMGDFDGTATPRLQDYYEERAKGGTGLIITEITRVNDLTGAGAFAQLGMSHDYQIPSMAQLAEKIHKHGAKVFVELHHPGRQNVGLLLYTVPMCIGAQKVWPGFGDFLYSLTPKVGPWMVEKKLVPSAVCPSKVMPSYVSGGRVRAITKTEIHQLVHQFIDAAERVKKAGCDGVELHASHGYLLQQFLSPKTNHRTDEYGGSLENRMRFIKEIIEGIRGRCGKDFPLIVRLSVDECYDRIGRASEGYHLAEGVAMAKKLEEFGVDAIDVSSASYDTFNYWLEPTSFDCGWRKNFAKAVKEVVSVPVLAANLIRSPEQAEAQLEEGIQDFVCLGRPHIADPHWTQKVESGCSADVKRCICCCYCIESMLNNAYKGTPAECSVNPRLGKEAALNELPKDGKGRSCIVVGAGPAGLTAAETLLDRGFAVTVYEKKKYCGGRVAMAAKGVPHKEKLGWITEDLEHSVRKKGGKIVLNTEVTGEMIKKLDPYAVIIAIGGFNILPKDLPGIDRPNVYTPDDILTGSRKFHDKQIAVIGSGLTGLETAEALAVAGNRVTVIEMANTAAPGVWMQHPDDLIPKLEALGVKILTGEKLVEIGEKSILTKNPQNQINYHGADAVILSLGLRPHYQLVDALLGRPNVFTAGDAHKQGRIVQATHEGFESALKVKA